MGGVRDSAWGRTASGVAQRWSIRDRIEPSRRLSKKADSKSWEFKVINDWDTALAASDPVLRLLRDVAGIDQVLFGTDFPYLRRDLAVNAKQRIRESSELNHLEKHAILGGNAARLFPRLHSLVQSFRNDSKP
jgi:hypothetical protein